LSTPCGADVPGLSCGDGEGGPAYNHEFGFNLPASSGFVKVFPNIVYDTYLTIGQAAGDFTSEEGPAASLSPNTGIDLTQSSIMSGPGVPGGNENGLGALFVTSDDPAGVPDDDGRVLIGQFTVPYGDFVSLWVNIDWNDFTGLGAGSGYYIASCIGLCTGLEPDLFNCNANIAGDDQKVDVFDLLGLLSQWGGCTSSCPADIDDSGAVDVFDLLALLDSWGECIDCSG